MLIPGCSVRRPGPRRHAQPWRESHDKARASARGLVHAPGGIRRPDEQIGRLVLQLPPGGREPDAAGGALEQCAPEILFERADLPVQHRLGDVELLGGPPEMLVLGDGGEVPELAQIQIHAFRVSILRNRYWTRPWSRAHCGAIQPLRKEASMICHTLVFSFGEDRTTAECDAFLAEVREICLESGMTSQVEARRHLPLPNDSYAQTFVSSAIVQIFCEDLTPSSGCPATTRWSSSSTTSSRSRTASCGSTTSRSRRRRGLTPGLSARLGPVVGLAPVRS